MNNPDLQRMVGALLAVGMVLFVMSGAPGMPGGAFRLWARRGAVGLYCLVLAGVIVYVLLWLVGLIG
jgi:hypothetical protein